MNEQSMVLNKLVHCPSDKSDKLLLHVQVYPLSWTLMLLKLIKVADIIHSMWRYKYVTVSITMCLSNYNFSLPMRPKQLFCTKCCMIRVFPVAELPWITIPPDVGKSVVKCSSISRNIHFLPTKVKREQESRSYIFLVLMLLNIAVFGTSKNNGFKCQSPFSTGAKIYRFPNIKWCLKIYISY